MVPGVPASYKYPAVQPGPRTTALVVTSGGLDLLPTEIRICYQQRFGFVTNRDSDFLLQEISISYLQRFGFVFVTDRDLNLLAAGFVFVS